MEVAIALKTTEKMVFSEEGCGGQWSTALPSSTVMVPYTWAAGHIEHLEPLCLLNDLQNMTFLGVTSFTPINGLEKLIRSQKGEPKTVDTYLAFLSPPYSAPLLSLWLDVRKVHNVVLIFITPNGVTLTDGSLKTIMSLPDVTQLRSRYA